MIPIECSPILRYRFLIGDLSPPEEDALTRHLNVCQKCQAKLESESGDDAMWQTAREWLACSSERIDTTADIRLGMPSQRAWRGFIESTLHQPNDLSFLSPSDDPAYIGRVGTYDIIGVIGQGGMGLVLKARDPILGRSVAIKVLSPALAGVGSARQRFAREARAMAALSHEHVVPIYAVDEHEGLPYLAMEYVPGGTLEHRLRDAGPLDVLSIVRIANQVARALTEAHESGLVHRDIKPGNILLDRGIERVRVADFGLATVANEASVTHTGLIAGTPLFMSPEQARSETCDPRSDLFGLGSVMYAMATGHAPFRADSLYGILYRIVNEPPRSIREQNPAIPDWLEAFVFRLLEKRPADRFSSAMEVSRHLDKEIAYLQSPNLTAAPEREWQRSDGISSKGGRWRASAGRSIAGGLLLTLSGWSAYHMAPTWFQRIASPKISTTRPPEISPKQFNAPLPESAVSEEPRMENMALWDDDGTAELQQRMDRLRNDAQTNSTTSSLDAWNDEIRRLRSAMDSMDP